MKLRGESGEGREAMAGRRHRARARWASRSPSSVPSRSGSTGVIPPNQRAYMAQGSFMGLALIIVGRGAVHPLLAGAVHAVLARADDLREPCEHRPPRRRDRAGRGPRRGSVARTRSPRRSRSSTLPARTVVRPTAVPGQSGPGLIDPTNLRDHRLASSDRARSPEILRKPAVRFAGCRRRARRLRIDSQAPLRPYRERIAALGTPGTPAYRCPSDPAAKEQATRSLQRSSGSFELVLAPVITALLGLWLDRTIGTVPLFTVLLAVLRLRRCRDLDVLPVQPPHGQHRSAVPGRVAPCRPRSRS